LTSSALRLGLALADVGWHPAAWREPGARAGELFTAGYWVDQLRAAESAQLDFVTIEDSFALQSTQPDGPDAHTDQVRGRLDAIMIAARVAPRTRQIGIVPAAATAMTEPFLVSTQIATLDHVSGGRAGWLAQVRAGPGQGAYVGPRGTSPPEAVFAEAVDHVEVVRRLWDSWEDGAEIRDAASGRFIDRNRIHHIDFDGPYFAVKGPSITPRSPQGQPIVATVAGTDAAYAFAAAGADLAFVAPHDDRELAAIVARLDAALARAAREPGQLQVFADVVVFLDHDPSAAADRQARLDAWAATANCPDALVFTGTPAGLAEQLIAWAELGARGFRLHPGAVPHDLLAITQGLVEELRARGKFRRQYEAHTLRGLLGLARPVSRYSAV
jgi:alkanesulfonate monooxygenase SsuD/methylene tetrahydromethanopterin reductase-like flavin-dependent oxidoreductase (luciferase family)